MILIRRVSGASMRPTITEGEVVVALRSRPRVGSIVIARQGGRKVVKRVQRIDDSTYYLVGDNSSESTDSRHYGNVSKSDILGTIMIVLPKGTNPPKLVKPYGFWLGRTAALVLTLVGLIHLFRIDTFIPILDNALPGGNVAASIAGLLIIISEIFAIPFALRMKLSPLARFMSGALLVLAPLWWVLIDIWSYGIVDNTGQLGEFVAVPSNTLVLVLNVLWLGFSYFTLYTLGYNRLKVRDILRK